MLKETLAHLSELLTVRTDPDWSGRENAGSASDLAEGSPRPPETTPTHHPAMAASRRWGPEHLEFLISSTCLGVNAKMHGLS